MSQEADGFSYAAAIKSCAGNWPLALKLLTHWPHDTVCFNSAMPQMPWTGHRGDCQQPKRPTLRYHTIERGFIWIYNGFT